MKAIYYECHITIEPILDERLDLLKSICSKHNFKVADLLMTKRSHDTPERSKNDSFCTSRNVDYNILHANMTSLVNEIRLNNLVVWRQKIEAVILDERFKNNAGI
jgi:hypothetical protein